MIPGSGLEIYSHKGRSCLRVRRYDKNAGRYITRSTGKHTVEEARAWALENLQLIFSEEVMERGGGNYSITRQLSAHMSHMEERHTAGEITESTLVGYHKVARHFIGWFSKNGIKKVCQLDNDLFKRYGLNRINLDEMSPNTVNLEIVYVRMWIDWLNTEGIIRKAIRVPSVKKAVENRTGSEPFAPGELKQIYKVTKEWVQEKPNTSNFGKRHVSRYNKQLFLLFIQLLDESGCRQHEIWNRTWGEISIGETKSDRKRIIDEIKIPQNAKRGARQCVFRGEALIRIKELQKNMCPNAGPNDYVFRSDQTNQLIDIATFSRYWSIIRQRSGVDRKLHTFRSHRITQLIMSGIEPQLVGRNLGLSLKQIEDTYLRFTPAAHFNKLVQEDIPMDNEIRKLM